ncbi:MAG TPA: hypothetical protein VMA72_05135, partial [Streptosporangiaceae bacterium]|nr:hypothetical protein [Streptosporangiaceae bacterium]
MTDPGWDIPGVPRDASPGPDARDEAAAAATVAASPTVASSPRRGRSGRKARAGSVSASSGLSAGAFAPLPDGSTPTADWSGSPSGSNSHSAEPAVAANAAACNGSAVADSSQCGSTCAASPGTAGAVSPGTASASAASTTTAPHVPATASADGCGTRTVSDGIFPAGIPPAEGAESLFRVRPDSPVQALAYLSGALDFLAHASPAEWAEGIQADCLRALAVAESQQTVAHATILQAFSVPGGGLAGDGHRSPRVWLTWQTAATRRAASSKVSWMHRLTAHPVISRALAGGSVSVSWAAQIMDWTRTLPGDVTDAADAELLAAAAA